MFASLVEDEQAASKMKIHVYPITFAEVDLRELGLAQISLLEVILVKTTPEVKTSITWKFFLELGEEELPHLSVHYSLKSGTTTNEVIREDRNDTLG